MNKDVIEDIIEVGLRKLDELPFGTETSIYSLIADKLKKIDIKLDVNDLFRINEEIKLKAEIKGIILDYSKYEDQDVGLPYNIPFVKIEKK